MMEHARTRLATVAVVGALTVAGGGVARAATASPSTTAAITTGTTRLYATDTGAARGPILFTGVIGDYGTTLSVDRSGQPDPNGNEVEVHLHRGSFRIDATALNQASDHFHADQTTCSGWVTSTASLPISGGTGRYRGIHGTIRVTDTYAVVAARVTSGPRKGSCSRNATLSQFDVITGAGSVVIP